MGLPTEPGVYRDARGDLWVLRDDQRWQHVERSLAQGRTYPVRGYGSVSAEALETLAREPRVDVLPLTKVQAPAHPGSEH